MATKGRLERLLKRSRDYWCSQIRGGREYQEDDVGFDDSYSNQVLMLLTDGMGGYAGGDIASQAVLDAFSQSFKLENEENISKRLDNSLTKANNKLALIAANNPKLQGMGCTFVGVVLSYQDPNLHWISVGDSPLWIFRNGVLIRLNEDHSKRIDIDNKVKKGEITALEARENPARNALTSALTGVAPSLIDNHSKCIKNEDIILLASDGIFSLSNKEIEKLMRISRTNNAEEITNNLVEAVKNKKKENQDNTSILIMKIPKNFK